MAVSRRARAILALTATATLVATSACSDDSTSGTDVPYDSDVTLTWWHNATEGEANALWASVAADFEALHPTVTIEIEAIQNETLQRTRIPAALQAGAPPPDVFMVWGGGEIIEQVQDGDYLKDLTPYLDDAFLDTIGALTPWQVDGKQYGLPFRWGLEGIWYNKDLFAQAGISSPPTTMTELNEAVEALKAANITPIAVGAGDNWPAAHWWYNFAIRACSTETLTQAANEHVFDDPCFVEAGNQLAEFVATEPFQADFVNTKAQEGAGSSAGMLGNGQAAMELMGDWNYGTARNLAADQDAFDEFIGWFPFPAVEGAPGDPTAALGGGDGWGCAKNAPVECVEFLKYLASVEVQTAYAESGAGIPVVKGADSGIDTEVIASIAAATANAGSAHLWLDTAYGTTIGTPMNAAIVAIFAGTGTPEQVVEAMKAAAAR
jgi:raffinose/stachyose/melibiose transport system substrate-binding protein